MDTELCDIAEAMAEIRELLAFPDTDDPQWIVDRLRVKLEVDAGTEPGDWECPLEEDVVTPIMHRKGVVYLTGITEKAEKNLSEAIDKAKLSILRAVHGRNKVANLLIALVDKVRENEDLYIWKCPDCGSEAVWDAKYSEDNGTPTCCRDMKPHHFALFDTEEWKEAEAYALRIRTVQDSKKKDNENDSDTT